MNVLVGGIRWIGLTVAMLLLTSLLGGCVTLTEQGAVLGGTVLIRPITDYREVPPEVLEGIAEEQGVALEEACINLMEADVDMLQNIVNIGPVRAKYLDDLRNLFVFSSADDLRIIPGIGERRLAQIKEQGLVCEVGG